MLQLDASGLLASLVSGLMPETGGLAAGGQETPADGFRQLLLDHLEEIVASVQEGQPGLDNPNLQSWLQDFGVPAEELQQPDFLAQLDALRHYLEALIPQAQTPAEVTVPGERTLGEWFSDKDTDENQDGDVLSDTVADSIPLPLEAVRDDGLEAVRFVAFESEERETATVDVESEDATSRSPVPEVAAAMPMPLSSGEDARSEPEAPVRMNQVSSLTVTMEPAGREVEHSAMGDDSQPSVAPPGQSDMEGGTMPFRLPLEGQIPRSPLPGGQAFAPPADIVVDRPVGHPGWGDELGERLVWMADRSLQVAELRVHPRHLGPVEVRIQIQDDQTHIQFNAQHAVVREAIEAALPRLREALAAQQMTLGQVEVSADAWQGQEQSPAQQDTSRHHDRRSEALTAMGSGEESLQANEDAPKAMGNRLVSLYA
ncbi:hypothetical protein MIN45_P0526 [Methylomarinovum tepidoasis]|uniref:Flagellar hook-length control protein-like C-terminal domain-containing protein n=1 Tax=Methylomarinovum tepidoasis TaxID=2840183 RepID=A0AAU9CPE4_9GAMM|nr:flagellar hook-length control protein FliK [Methylomarinovum sp. IN45]BCX88158.1 hypothetical protein MIN45_P0526 [Methylomarinovum sp. IN45]